MTNAPDEFDEADSLEERDLDINLDPEVDLGAAL
jgi:hypothetical protein